MNQETDTQRRGSTTIGHQRHWARPQPDKEQEGPRLAYLWRSHRELTAALHDESPDNRACARKSHMFKITRSPVVKYRSDMLSRM